MKLRVFKGIGKNGKAYWSISGKNYKDINDKITYFVRFAKCNEPSAINGVSKNGTTYSYADIDVEEMKFECYNQTPQLSIFKYTQDETSIYNQETNEIDTSMMGGQTPEIDGEEQEELPFY